MAFSYKKGFEISRYIATFVGAIFFVLATSNVLGIELHEPCDLKDDKACSTYNTSTVICLPLRPNTNNSLPDEPGFCNCKWNKDYPDEYDLPLPETSFDCVTLVGGHCRNDGVEPRACDENALCKNPISSNDTFGRCECQEHFMDDGTKRCVKRTLGYHENCVINNQPVDYPCRPELECINNVNLNKDSKWCDCIGNENEENYKFFGNKCRALFNTDCDGDETCFQNTINSTFCNDKKKCDCNSGFFVNEKRECTKNEPIDDEKFLDYSEECQVGNIFKLCKNYSDTVDCFTPAHSAGNIKPMCSCKGNEKFPKGEYGYEFHKDLAKCLALFGSECGDKSNTTADCIQNSHCGATNGHGTKTCQCDGGYEHVYYKKCEKSQDTDDVMTSTTGRANEHVVNNLLALSLTLVTVVLMSIPKITIFPLE